MTIAVVTEGRRAGVARDKCLWNSQMRRTSADVGLRRKYQVGISSLEVFPAVQSVLVTLVAAVKMPRLYCPVRPAWKTAWSSSFFPKGLQIACQLNHNRDSGSQDNLTSGYHGVSSQRLKPKVSAFTYRYRVNVDPDRD
ncbi:hypothetical protein DMN91_010402 [Ooceraea biroi]|uniref:Uncharacterized protein n=1 Tax=Ooceraea biroi TaxID=2015173 RepID=A0A3L8DE42_OOCBI|nr:hypothetical protein DMN91_010402 [Ooceraea biroi]